MMGLDTVSLDWAAALWRGAWQGSALFIAVGIVCKTAPRIPATVRYWLWWIVCLKFILGALVAPVIPLIILPTGQNVRVLQSRFSTTVASTVTTIAMNAGKIALRETDALPSPPEQTAGYRGTSDAGAAHPPIRPRTTWTMPSPISTLFVLWLTGVTLSLAFAAARSIAVFGVIRRARWASATVSELLTSLSASSVHALETDEITGVCVAGVISPVLLIPASWAEALTPDELKMAIAHEAAHLRRRDLWLDLVPAVASTLFFFLPPALIARRACGLAGEEACDADAVKEVSCTFASYAAMLLKSVGASPHAVGVLGFSPAYRQLHARLTGLELSSKPVQVGIKIVSFSIVALALLSSAPWRVSARTTQKPSDNSIDSVRYQLIDLGKITGADATQFQINDRGQVIGTSGGQPFLWRDGKMQCLGTLGYPGGRRGGINDTGAYVATCYSRMGNPHAFVYGNRAHILTGLSGYRFTIARSINNNDLIAGSAQHSGADDLGAEITRAVLVDQGRTLDLGTLGGEYSAAYALNSSGQIAGKADLAPSVDGGRPTHAFLWQKGKIRDLGTLGGTYSLAYALNDAGIAAGFSLVSGDADRHACLWKTNNGEIGACVDLGALPDDRASEAHGINDSGEIVGTSDRTSDAANNRAVLWEGSKTLDLNTVVDVSGDWHLQDAMAVNNRGSIVGKGTLNGEVHAFVLVPITAN